MNVIFIPVIRNPAVVGLVVVIVISLCLLLHPVMVDFVLDR